MVQGAPCELQFEFGGVWDLLKSYEICGFYIDLDPEFVGENYSRILARSSRDELRAAIASVKARRLILKDWGIVRIKEGVDRG